MPDLESVEGVKVPLAAHEPPLVTPKSPRTRPMPMSTWRMRKSLELNFGLGPDALIQPILTSCLASENFKNSTLVWGNAVWFNTVEQVTQENDHLHTYNLDNVPNTVNKSGAIPIESRMSVALIKAENQAWYVDGNLHDRDIAVFVEVHVEE
ncbi:hypothetical protein G7Y89_g11057 [Cudoniella acicularis]|uniref:Uncharacterized protein n=1 Tax=Cudoniella acicularis TaxID=354080 RepID=A0A8H4RE88_9HELO|nr:hypothetical protein G7Y89_g11057 [Cudoniella acicularis]